MSVCGREFHVQQKLVRRRRRIDEADTSTLVAVEQLAANCLDEALGLETKTPRPEMQVLTHSTCPYRASRRKSPSPEEVK
ncbi:hypothetical protein TNCV_4357171 [Trichonephila clavipes]|nr:hypothetical protein TNCV_4357171 [Trichonephila clavipes]